MITKHQRSGILALSLVALLYVPGFSAAEHAQSRDGQGHDSPAWQEKAVEYARIMSRVKWAPVASGMPIRGGGFFKKGTEYTGVPYSSVKSVGRYIGFDIFLKTFLAAVQNPHSVLYTENLSGDVPNAACYYGKVCSSYTSYALQCGIWYVSRLHPPPHRNAVKLVEPQSAQAARIGDFIFTPPSPGSHVEIVTEVTKSGDTVTHVRVEESRPPTTTNRNRSASNFNSHISSRGRKLYRITDLDTWREDNKAESFLFPNYDEDVATPTINRVLLLDRGDWVPYFKDQDVKINVMDKDSQGVKTLVVTRGGTVVEEISLSGTGITKRSFPTCGDYTAHCVMNDGSRSRACEFSVCDLDFSLCVDEVTLNESWDIEFTSDNMDVIIVHLISDENTYGHYDVWVTEQDRQNGKVAIPADLVQDAGNLQVWLIGENRYGRLKKRQDIAVVK